MSRKPNKINLINGQSRRESIDTCLDNLSNDFSYYKDLVKRSSTTDNVRTYSCLVQSDTNRRQLTPTKPKIVIHSPDSSELPISIDADSNNRYSKQFPKQSILKKTSKYTSDSNNHGNEIEKELAELDRLRSRYKQPTLTSRDKSVVINASDTDNILQYELDCLERVLSNSNNMSATDSTTDGSLLNLQFCSSSISSSLRSVSPADTPFNCYNKLMSDGSSSNDNRDYSHSANSIFMHKDSQGFIDNRAPLPFAFDNLSTGGIKGNIATVGAVTPDKPYPPFAKSVRKYR